MLDGEVYAFATPQNEYEGFVAGGGLGPDVNAGPTAFSQHIQDLERLALRLNYRFLELDSKLRFLRLVASGHAVEMGQMDSQSAQAAELSASVSALEDRLEEARRETRALRKKIGRCLYQNEVRRCVEGREKLEEEIRALEEEVESVRGWFGEKGIADALFIENQAPNKGTPYGGSVTDIAAADDDSYGEALRTNLETLQSTLQSTQSRIASTTTSLDSLRSQQASLRANLSAVHTHRESLSPRDAAKLARIAHLKNTIQALDS